MSQPDNHVLCCACCHMGRCLVAGSKVDLANGKEDLVVFPYWQLPVIVQKLEPVHLHSLAIIL